MKFSQALTALNELTDKKASHFFGKKKELLLAKAVSVGIARKEGDNYIFDMDPSGGKYEIFILRMLDKGHIGMHGFEENLALFHEGVRRKRTRGLDLTIASYEEFANAADKYKWEKETEETKKEFQAQTAMPIKPPYKMYKITDPDACVSLTAGQGWCVKDHEWATSYLEHGHLIMFSKGNKPHALLAGSSEFRDVQNKPLAFEKQIAIMDALDVRESKGEVTEQDKYEDWLEINGYSPSGLATDDDGFYYVNRDEYKEYFDEWTNNRMHDELSYSWRDSAEDGDVSFFESYPELEKSMKEEFDEYEMNSLNYYEDIKPFLEREHEEFLETEYEHTTDQEIESMPGSGFYEEDFDYKQRIYLPEKVEEFRHMLVFDKEGRDMSADDVPDHLRRNKHEEFKEEMEGITGKVVRRRKNFYEQMKRL